MKLTAEDAPSTHDRSELDAVVGRRQAVHAEAEDEERLAGGDVAAQRLLEPARADLLHGTTERADTRKDEAWKVRQALGVIDHLDVVAQVNHRVAKRSEIAHPVVDDPDHRITRSAAGRLRAPSSSAFLRSSDGPVPLPRPLPVASPRYMSSCSQAAAASPV